MSTKAKREYVLYEKKGDLVTITMNRPDKRNALSEAHILELLEVFKKAGADTDARAVILGCFFFFFFCNDLCIFFFFSRS